MMSYNIRQRPDEQAEALGAMQREPYSKDVPEQHQPYSVGEGDMTNAEYEAMERVHAPPPVLDAFLASPTGKGGF